PVGGTHGSRDPQFGDIEPVENRAQPDGMSTVTHRSQYDLVAVPRPTAGQSPRCLGSQAESLQHMLRRLLAGDGVRSGHTGNLPRAGDVSGHRHADARTSTADVPVSGKGHQYVGRLGSTWLAHAVTPPPTCVASENPARCRAASASAERPPVLQCSTIGLSCGNSANAAPERMLSFGTNFAPGILTISNSCGSRTSISSKSSPRSNFCFSSSAVIVLPTLACCASSLATPQNSS